MESFKKNWPGIKKWLVNIGLAVLLCIGIVALIAVLPIRNNIKFLSVMSGSMSPKIHVGSLIVIRPASQYSVDDIITFRTPMADKANDYTTHRIVEIRDDNNAKYIVTKGDANDGPDGSKIAEEDIIGKHLLTLPLLGYLFAFIKTLTGLIVIVLIPSLLIIIAEIRKIVLEIRRFRQAKSPVVEVQPVVKEIVPEAVQPIPVTSAKQHHKHKKNKKKKSKKKFRR